MRMCEWVKKGIKEILNATAKKGTPSKREHSEIWTLIGEKIRSLPTGWLEAEHVPGHATEEMVMQGRALEEHRMANNQVGSSCETRGSQRWTATSADRGVIGKS